MEGRCEDVETSASHFSSAVSPSHEVDGFVSNLAVAWYMLWAKVDNPQP